LAAIRDNYRLGFHRRPPFCLSPINAAKRGEKGQRKQRNRCLPGDLETCQGLVRHSQRSTSLQEPTWDNGAPEILLNSISRYYMPGEQQQAFLENLREKAS